MNPGLAGLSARRRIMVGMTEDRILRMTSDEPGVTLGEGEYRKGAQVVSTTMDPTFDPPSGSMNPEAIVTPLWTPADIPAPTLPPDTGKPGAAPAE